MICVSTGAFPDLTGDRAARLLLEAGIDAIELSGGRHDPGLYDALLALRGRARFRVHNYFPPPREPFVFNLASADPQIAARSLAHARTAIDWAAQLGQPVYGLHSGFLFDPRVDELGRRIERRTLLPREEGMETFLERVETLADHARERGVALLIENNALARRNLESFGTNPLLMCDADEMLRVVRKIPDNVKLLLDVAHLKVAAASLGFDPAQALQALRPWIGGYHLSDNDGTADSNEPFARDAWFWPHLETGLDYYTLEVYTRDLAVLRAQLQLTREMLGR